MLAVRTNSLGGTALKRLNTFKNASYARQIQIFSLGFLIPILLMTILVNFLISVPIQRAYIKQSNDQVASEVKNVDTQISQIETMVANWGYSFSTQYSIRNYGPNIAREDFSAISRNLFLIENSNPLITKCELVYLGKNGFFLDQSGTWAVADHSAAQLYAIDNKQNFQWKKMDATHMTLLTDLSSAVNSDHHLFLATTVDSTVLLDMLSASAVSGGSNILTINGQPFASTGKAAKALLKSDHNTRTQINGESYNVATASFNRLKQRWTIHSAVPLNQITAPIHHFLTLMLTIAGIGLILSLALSFLFTRYQYAPLKQLMTQLFGKEQWTKTNEYAYLTAKWHDMMQHQSSLEKVAATAVHHSRQMIIRQIIDGYFRYLTEPELKKVAVDNGWHDYQNHYVLIAIQLHAQLTPTAVHQEHKEFIPYAFENIVMDIADDTFSNYAVVERSINRLLVFTTDIDREQSKQFAHNLATSVEHVLNCYITATYCLPQTELSALPELSQQLLRRLTYRTIALRSETIQADHDQPVINYAYPQNIEALLVLAFKENHDAELLAHLKEFIHAVIRQDPHQVALLVAVSRLYDTIDGLLRQQQVSPGDYLAKKRLTDLLTNLLDAEALVTVLHQSFLVPAKALYHTEVQKNGNSLATEMLAYLDSHYADPDLSLELLADHFHADPSTLSRAFKNKLHTTFIDYVTDLRLVECKRQLLETNRQIRDIAESMGYTSSYFNRLFKRKVGMTPGQYRKDGSTGITENN